MEPSLLGRWPTMLRWWGALIAACCLACTSAGNVPQRRPVLLDCDPGTDDVFALLWICARFDALELVAVTTIPGNVEGSKVLRNAVGAMRFFDCGANASVGVGKEPHRESDGFMGQDGLNGLAGALPPVALAQEVPDAADVILEAIDRFGSELALVSVGPLTNLAVAERRRPGALARVRDLLIMGGAIAGGNVKAYAEFNFWYDAPSVKAVLASVAHAVLFTLDVTEQLCFRGNYTDLLVSEAPGAQSEMLRSLAAAAAAQSREWGQRCLFLHDVMPVGFLLDPAMFQVARANIDISVGPEKEGHTFLVPLGRPNAWYAVSAAPVLFDVLANDAVRYLRGLRAEAPRHGEL